MKSLTILFFQTWPKNWKAFPRSLSIVLYFIILLQIKAFGPWKLRLLNWEVEPKWKLVVHQLLHSLVPLSIIMYEILL